MLTDFYMGSNTEVVQRFLKTERTEVDYLQAEITAQLKCKKVDDNKLLYLHCKRMVSVIAVTFYRKALEIAYKQEQSKIGSVAIVDHITTLLIKGDHKKAQTELDRHSELACITDEDIQLSSNKTRDLQKAIKYVFILDV